MPFEITPDVRKIKESAGLGRAQWRTVGPLLYRRVEPPTAYIVPAGFVTDFASVPRLPFAYLLTGDTAHMSAILHDHLCRKLVPSEMTWREAADIFREAMADEGVPGWRRWLMYWAVRLAGKTTR